MKNVILLIVLVKTSFLFAQMPVTDATANTQLAEQVATSTKQLAQLQKTYEVVKKGQEQYQKVNNAIMQLSLIEDIIKTQRKAIDDAKYCLDKSDGNLKFVANDINKSLAQINNSINTINKVLQNNIFNMSDSERIQFIENEKQKVNNASMEIRIKRIKLSY